jgi:hypothetical protein
MSIEATIEEKIHAVHLWIDRLIGHGVPADVIAEGKILASAALPTVEAVAAPIAEKEIKAEVPTELQPAAEALVPVVESAAAEAVAPVVE